MAGRRIDLARARVLVTNDDGIHAPGIALLERIARSLGAEVWVVAPETEQSAASHSLTLRHPLRIREIADEEGGGRRRYAIDGTPTDSVLLAINHIMKDHRPDLVLSGINRGGNLGEDVTYSGTVSAAMEATLLGVPAIALSQDKSNAAPVSWATAERYAGEVVRRLVEVPWPANVLMNVNFPDLPPERVKGIRVVQQGRRKIGDDLATGVDPRGEPYYWIGSMRREEPSRGNSDIAAVAGGWIAVTPLHLDLTHRPTLLALRKEFG